MEDTIITDEKTEAKKLKLSIGLLIGRVAKARLETRELDSRATI